MITKLNTQCWVSALDGTLAIKNLAMSVAVTIADSQAQTDYKIATQCAGRYISFRQKKVGLESVVDHQIFIVPIGVFLLRMDSSLCVTTPLLWVKNGRINRIRQLLSRFEALAGMYSYACMQRA